MSQTKINKQEGAEMRCSTCGMDLICKSFEFQGTHQLSWCDKDSGLKHYNFDHETNRTSCKYMIIQDQLEYLLRIEKFVQHKLGNTTEQRRWLFTELIFNKTYK